MEDIGNPIPLQREKIVTMKERFEDALQGTYDPASDDFVPEEERTRETARRHLFDFMDGMRMKVSLHNTEEGLAIHGMCVWHDKKAQPRHREDGLKVLAKRLARLIEEAGVAERCPDPIDLGVPQSGVPHIFFPYPSAAFNLEA